MKKEAMQASQRAGGVAGIVLAVALVSLLAFLIALPAFGVQPPGNPAKGLDLAMRRPELYAVQGWLGLAFSCAMFVVALAFYDRLAAGSPFLARVASAAGIVGSSLIATSSLTYIAEGGQLSVYDAQSHELGTAAYVALATFEEIAFRAGSAGFGAFLVLAHWRAQRQHTLPTALAYLGVLTGAVNIVRGLLGSLGPVGLLVPLLLIAWSASFGVTSLRRPKLG